jgi:hypothetical protein
MTIRQDWIKTFSPETEERGYRCSGCQLTFSEPRIHACHDMEAQAEKRQRDMDRWSSYSAKSLEEAREFADMADEARRMRVRLEELAKW